MYLVISFQYSILRAQYFLTQLSMKSNKISNTQCKFRRKNKWIRAADPTKIAFNHPATVRLVRMIRYPDDRRH